MRIESVFRERDLGLGLTAPVSQENDGERSICWWGKKRNAAAFRSPIYQCFRLEFTAQDSGGFVAIYPPAAGPVCAQLQPLSLVGRFGVTSWVCPQARRWSQRSTEQTLLCPTDRLNRYWRTNIGQSLHWGRSPILLFFQALISSSLLDRAGICLLNQTSCFITAWLYYGTEGVFSPVYVLDQIADQVRWEG